MAMQKQKWSISGLSVELGIDRRTLARKLDGLQPAEVKGKSNLYYMSDVFRRLQELDSPRSQHRDFVEGADLLLANEVALLFDEWGEALSYLLWDSMGTKDGESIEHAESVLAVLLSIWELHLGALKGYFTTKSSPPIEIPRIIEILQDSDGFKAEAVALFEHGPPIKTEPSKIDFDSIEFDLSGI